MKKIILLALLLGVGTPLFAQSTFSFANSSTTLITTNLSGTVGTYVQGTSGVGTFEAWVGPANAPDSSSLAPIGTTASSATAGRIFGGTRTNANVGPGAVFSLQIRGWVGAATYALAQTTPGAAWGITSIVQVDGGDPTAVPPGTPTTVFGTTPGLIPGIVLNVVPVPEPSSIALGLLGLGAITLFRRRK